MDCINGMKEMQDNSVDSIVTDPPYLLNFMNKEWDNTGITYNTDVWKEALRVLKPGGYLLAFGGTRTYHRMASAIEDAGFEIRDQLQWIYGSGWPKSAHTALKPAHEDIVVAMKPITVDDVFGNIFMEVSGWSQLLVYAAERNFKLNLRDSKEESSIAQWLVKENIDTQDALNEAMDTLRSETVTETIDLSTILSWKNTLDEGCAMMNRYTIGTKLETITTWITSNFLLSQNTPSSTASPETSQSGKPVYVSTVQRSFSAELTKLTIILPRFAQENATLKENEKGSVNNEPIVLARKPLSEKTVAANVLRWGTGGLNIDGCRIGKETLCSHGGTTKANNKIYGNGKGLPEVIKGSNVHEGRFPSNVILDEAAAKLLDEQTGTLKSGKNCIRSKSGTFLEHGGLGKTGDIQKTYGDSGGASRFFYCAKASRKERNEGLQGENVHPTVKPLKLMKYLVRLVTPPNGTVLDPFSGSGTTLIAAKEQGFNFIGFEKEQEYCEIAEKRLAVAQ